MSISLEELAEQASTLSAEDRAKLAEAMLKSLSAPTSKVESAWEEEVELRVAAHHRGEIPSYAANEVFAEARRSGLHMLHHISLGVSDIETAARFYDAVLAPLGYVRVWALLRPGEKNQAVGYGPPGSGDKLAIKQRPNVSSAGPGFHLAFSAPTREAIHLFHEAALRNGGRDNGRPGLRPHYGEHYYAAFVIDSDGHHLEAVINSPD